MFSNSSHFFPSQLGAQFGEYVGDEVFPGASVSTDAQIDQYIRDSVHTANALVGTCKMGAESDASAVVTPDLRVKGVTGLRVVGEKRERPFFDA